MAKAKKNPQETAFCNTGSPVSPLATHEYRHFATLMLGIPEFVRVIKSGFRPRSGDPKAWYDRAIRGGGGLFVLLFLVAGILLKLFGK